MLKSIAMARSECTAKQENKASYNTYCIVPDLIGFFDDNCEEIIILFIIVKNYVLTKNWFVFSKFLEFSKDHTEK